MTVKEIVFIYLRDHGYDGLCNDLCGCGLDDLMPCCDPMNECKPAYEIKCDHHCDDKRLKLSSCFSTNKNETKCIEED